jgi:hypothetical protein
MKQILIIAIAAFYSISVFKVESVEFSRDKENKDETFDNSVLFDEKNKLNDASTWEKSVDQDERLFDEQGTDDQIVVNQEFDDQRLEAPPGPPTGGVTPVGDGFGVFLICLGGYLSYRSVKFGKFKKVN